MRIGYRSGKEEPLPTKVRITSDYSGRLGSAVGLEVVSLEKSRFPGDLLGLRTYRRLRTTGRRTTVSVYRSVCLTAECVLVRVIDSFTDKFCPEST